MHDLPSKTAISARDLSKFYQLGVLNRTTFRDELLYRWYTMRGIDPRTQLGKVHKNKILGKRLFCALDHVSFDVERGETVGLIGRNGAGKSTLLKILSQITTPDTGEALIRGRVGSLLEVGTGFHPELTGRENIYMNGAILGMKKREIDSKFGEIVDFSEIGPFLDTPVKRYSSGMYVKLAFSVAASLDTDILLIDEVLAVGDAAFREKSLARMQQIASDGRTVLFVSHSIENVKKICSRCLLFDHGKIIEDGPTDKVAGRYFLESFSTPPIPPPPSVLPSPLSLSGLQSELDAGKGQWHFRVSYSRGGGAPVRPRAVLSIRRSLGPDTPVIILDSACHPGENPLSSADGGTIDFRLSKDFRFSMGDYFIDLQLLDGDMVLQDVPKAHFFTVSEGDDLLPGCRRLPGHQALVHIAHDCRR